MRLLPFHNPSSHQPAASPLLLILVTAIAYGVTGRLGLLLAIPPGYATAIWPPSGIALAALLVGGVRVWPGVVLGSVLVNIWTAFDTSSAGAMLLSVARALGIGGGAAVQAVVGALLVQRYVGFPHPLDREKAVGLFLLLGGPVSCLISATIGITTLFLSDMIPWAMVFVSWWTWWVGDTIGVLIVTPLVCIWTAEPRRVWRQRRLSMAVPLGVVFGLAVVFFVYASARERYRIQFAFERQASTLAQGFRDSLDNYLDVLHAVERLYASAPEVSRQQFRTFVQWAFARHPGLQALSWDVRVPDADRAAYEEAARREGYGGFQITDPEPRQQQHKVPRRAAASHPHQRQTPGRGVGVCGA